MTELGPWRPSAANQPAVEGEDEAAVGELGTRMWCRRMGEEEGRGFCVGLWRGRASEQAVERETRESRQPAGFCETS